MPLKYAPLIQDVEQSGWVVDDRLGPPGLQLLDRAEPPGGADRVHPGAEGRLHVHGGVAQVEEGPGRQAERPRDLPRPGGVWLAGRAVAVAEHRAERPARQVLGGAEA